MHPTIKQSRCFWSMAGCGVLFLSSKGSSWSKQLVKCTFSVDAFWTSKVKAWGNTAYKLWTSFLRERCNLNFVWPNTGIWFNITRVILPTYLSECVCVLARMCVCSPMCKCQRSYTCILVTVIHVVYIYVCIKSVYPSIVW